jgi:cytochrome P450
MVRQPTLVSGYSAKSYKDIYDNERVTKSQVYLATRLSPSFNIFNAIDQDLHRSKRKVIGQAVSERSMRIFEPVMQEQIHKLVQHLREASQQSNPVNITTRCKYFGMDIVGRLAFGYSLNLQSNPANRHIIATIRESSMRLNVYMQWPFLAKLHLEIIALLLLMIQKDGYLSLLQRMIKAREDQKPHAQHDLYSIVAGSSNKSNKDGVPLKDVWSEALFFFPAGKLAVESCLKII